eukprot:gnl/MRDRNA2_/MRDRNA2_167909_c0_seq1.p1 gnl/MRDRNA2_/MRDRNA2_167909_c0~~gnl/MRDRNA2_/MRDRNA2_167909_c0_seq1.p1  ORF type:complete len:531 (-),score=90.94 gnl/MRDRNA2_/MRDRNA2_167909_c0_seq1:182-1774(-)
MDSSKFQHLPPLDERFEPAAFNLNSYGCCPPSDEVDSLGTSQGTSEWSIAQTIGTYGKNMEREATARNEDLVLEATAVVGKKGIGLSNLIGSGVSSQVFLGTGTMGWVAVKAVLDGMCSEAERDLISKIKHPHIAQIFGVMEGPPLCYIMEYCIGGDLFKALHSRVKTTKKLVPMGRACQMSIACDVANAIGYIHSEGLIHRDIKSPNVLLETPICGTRCKPTAKLADFGLSKKNQQFNTCCVGTVRWMAPDLASEDYGFSADVYSFGILLWEILSRKIPYAQDKSDHKLFLKVCLEGKRPDVSECPFISSDMAQLMPRCWAKDANSRPSMPEVHALLMAHFDSSSHLVNLYLDDSDTENKSEEEPVVIRGVHDTQDRTFCRAQSLDSQSSVEPEPRLASAFFGTGSSEVSYTASTATGTSQHTSSLDTAAFTSNKSAMSQCSGISSVSTLTTESLPAARTLNHSAAVTNLAPESPESQQCSALVGNEPQGLRVSDEGTRKGDNVSCSCLHGLLLFMKRPVLGSEMNVTS